MIEMSSAGRRVAGAIAALAWFAVALQLVLSMGAAVTAGGAVATTLVNFFSFFTILTNLLVAVVMTRIAIGRPTSASLAGATTLSIAVVGLVYSIALRSIWSPQGWQKVADMALHDATPLAAVLFWLALVPHGRLAWRNVWLWLAYPLGYLAYALARGAVDGWYAYWFLDAGRIGYAVFFRNAAVIAALFLLLACALVGLDKLLARRDERPGHSSP